MANYAVDSLQDGCYPGTAVLINTLNIRNQADLDAVEGTIIPARLLYGKKNHLAESFDFAHYCAIHRFCLKIYTNGRASRERWIFQRKARSFAPLRKLKAQRKPSLPD